MDKIIKTDQKYIYKYLSINEFTLRNLINNEFYFSHPNNFNDPFDCQFKLKLIEGSEAEQSFMESLDLNDHEKKIFITHNLKSKLSEEFEEKFNFGLVNSIGVTCFSEINNNFLMWSHYAKGHTGLCLKFDWRVHEEYFQGEKVIYDNKLPLVDYSSVEKFKHELKRIVLTKLKFWESEREVRSVVYIGESKKRNLSFNPQALSGVIFGDKTSEKDIEIIKKIIQMNNGYSNVEFQRARLIREKSNISINAL